MSSSQPSHHDAELILKLYELRREPVMREARAHYASLAPSIDAFLAVAANPMTKENSYVRQVCGYWEMTASLVVHGTLNALLVYDACQEMYFVYAKIQPFLEELRQKSGMTDFFCQRGEGRRRLCGRPRTRRSHAEAPGGNGPAPQRSRQGNGLA
jgi:hypothetical protein